MITLWLSVGSGVEGVNETTLRYELWVRIMPTYSVPLVGDTVVLWPDEDGDVTGGPTWTVRRRFVDWVGAWHCELTKMVVDPNDVVLMSMRHGPLEPAPYATSWWTANDGDPAAGLRRGGWMTYADFKEKASQ